ncbi:BPSL0067 family protein [Massilia endophytica]|uniref:BPSL0067 family protein n=1 Tax=Massilia endophytica TaxID=2899220 RepID=UPI001E607562|nr:BPSL0067 family protein [Massilia endophytica]UGQ45442.1 BPSL0067 family protein [Massilia endophytica]
MPYVYSDVRKLQDKPKVDGGECVRLVQHYTNVGHTTTWRQGERVLDATIIAPGTVIANFTREGRWPGKTKGNHAAFFVEFGPRGPDGKPTSIVMMDQWTGDRKKAISVRSVPRRGQKMHSEGNIYDDSDNAEHFYVVK